MQVSFFLCTFAPAKLNHGVLAHLARFFFLLFPGIKCRYFFALHFLHFLHFPLHSANSANSAVHFFISLIASECYSDIFLLRRARDESLVIPWRYLGGSLDVTLPNTYPKSRQTKRMVRKPYFCREEATRTPDPYVPNVVRYQLRYFSKKRAKVLLFFDICKFFCNYFALFRLNVRFPGFNGSDCAII